jgi:hypothetical protein
MGRHYLFPMWEGGGNVPPILGVARRVIARGHTVTVLGDPTIQVEAERFGCRFLPWRRAPHRTTLLPEDDLMRDWETKNPFQMLRRYRDRFITDPAPAYAADTLDAIAATSPDLVVPEYTIFGAFVAAEKAKLRAVARSQHLADARGRRASVRTGLPSGPHPAWAHARCALSQAGDLDLRSRAALAERDARRARPAAAHGVLRPGVAL